MSFFEKVSLAASDPILGLNAAFYKDDRPFKVNLTAGVYKTEELKTPIMQCVKTYEQKLVHEEDTKEYLPIDGDKKYLQEVGKLVFGKEFWRDQSAKISSFQTLGGTGALRVAGEFFHQEIHSGLYVSDPSWPNHKGVFSQCGFSVGTYPYYDLQTNTLQFDKMMSALKNLPAKSIVVLHACCHNPSGLDPTLKQWEEVAEVCRSKELIPFFDAAYLGLDKGLEEDAAAIRLFAEKGMEMAVAVSFSKNFSLYGERVGTLFIVSSDITVAEKITSQVKILIRRNYSNPPLHGAKVITGILSHDAYRMSWELELSQMRERIAHMKRVFAEGLVSKVKTKDYRYLGNTKGMFCFCGLEKVQVERLIKEYGVYMTHDGRINVAGLTLTSMEYVINAIANVIG